MIVVNSLQDYIRLRTEIGCKIKLFKAVATQIKAVGPTAFFPLTNERILEKVSR